MSCSDIYPSDFSVSGICLSQNAYCVSVKFPFITPFLLHCASCEDNLSLYI